MTALFARASGNSATEAKGFEPNEMQAALTKALTVTAKVKSPEVKAVVGTRELKMRAAVQRKPVVKSRLPVATLEVSPR